MASAPSATLRATPAAPPALKRLKRFLRYGLIRLALALVGLLPARAAGRLGEWFGHLGFLLARKERDKAFDSLGVAFPDLSEIERYDIGRECFRHLGRCAFELACVEKIDARVDEWIDWPAEDRRVLEEALARKKGVVFVSGHLGSWELLARRVALAGFPCQTIARETSDPRTTALVERFRAASGLKSIWRGQPGAAKQMLRALKAGEILGLLIDQDTKVQSIFVPFFGRLASTPRAAADLALRTRAAVVFGACRRTAPGRYQLTMKELPLPADPVELTAALTAQIEHAIRQAPEQWVWTHQRWKTRPPDGS